MYKIQINKNHVEVVVLENIEAMRIINDPGDGSIDLVIITPRITITKEFRKFADAKKELDAIIAARKRAKKVQK